MNINPNLKLLSYSSSLLLHSCPRKYQLIKLSSDLEREVNVTLAFGTVFGIGIQEYIIYADIDKAIWAMFLNWELDLREEESYSNKSFWAACSAIQSFPHSEEGQELLDMYEVAIINGRPANELTFRIGINDFSYRGAVDLVLKNKRTKEYAVLEVKHTGKKWIHEATYRNSAQALGYSVVLDKLVPGLSSYKVLYLVYQTSSHKYNLLPFPKSITAKAQWITNILQDIDAIERYSRDDSFPQYGESCMGWNRECQFYGVCGMSTENIVSKIKDHTNEEDAKVYDVNIELHELIASQLEAIS